jgi:hypothetical protein
MTSSVTSQMHTIFESELASKQYSTWFMFHDGGIVPNSVMLMFPIYFPQKHYQATTLESI